MKKKKKFVNSYPTDISYIPEFNSGFISEVS